MSISDIFNFLDKLSDDEIDTLNVDEFVQNIIKSSHD